MSDIPVSGRYDGVATSTVYENYISTPLPREAGTGRALESPASAEAFGGESTLMGIELPAEDLTQEIPVPNDHG